MAKHRDLHCRPKNLDRKLAAYALASGAVVGTAGSAEAGLVTTFVNQTISTGSTSPTVVALNVGGQNVLTFGTSTTTTTATIDLNLGSSTALIIDLTSHALTPLNLAPGTTISNASDFFKVGSDGPIDPFPYLVAEYDTDGTSAGHFVNVANGYLGFKFANSNVNGGQDYGYVSFGLSTGTSQPSASLTINSFTYDDSGAAVTIPAVSSVPEPASLTLLAMGASGVALLAHRRKRTG